MPTNDGGEPKHVSLVIGSGSVKCAAAIGLENVLRREGIAIDSVVGCSGGSIYAALIAMGYEAQTAREVTLRLWTHDITARHHMHSVFRMAMPRVFGFDEQFGVIDDRLVMKRLRAAFDGRTFEQMPIPLYLVATDFHTGEQVVLSEGNLKEHIHLFDTDKIPYIIEEGERATEEQLPELRRLLESHA